MIPSNQFWFNSGNSAIVYDVDAQLYFDTVLSNGLANGLTEQEVTLTPYSKGLINAIILGFKSRNEWDELNVFHILSNQNQIASRTSIKNPTRPMCDFNGLFGSSYMWRPYFGYTVLALGGHISTKFNPSIDGGSTYTLNSASQFIGISENVDGVLVDMGGTDGVSKSYIFSALSGTSYHALNTPAAGPDTTFLNPSNINEKYASIRNSAGDFDAYKADTKTDGTGTSNTLPNIELFVGAYNNNGLTQFPKIGATYQYYGFGSKNINVAALNANLDILLNQKEYWAFGNSITYGNNGSVLVTGWADRIAAQRGVKMINRGVNSTCLQYISPFDPAASPSMYNNLGAIPIYDSNKHGLISFNYNVNDTGFNYANYTVANYKTQLLAVINQCLVNGWPANRIFILDGTIVNNAVAWNGYVTFYGVPVAANDARYVLIQTAQQEAATATGVININPRNYMTSHGGLTLLADNDKHPSNLGYQVITDYALPFIPKVY